ncbi:hypothetical protein KPL78_29580 [Roseomonas sp. HJA6]|uniref:DUF2635 domain-containing protein n=1 Tax=Roseomonas alba TaxID=2846776 RepID=A0ABS7ALM2_9PROT|nr:hypothetical protein [Neoroseomonas alba]MBW6402034.1 hypothetical protein [Neoroseomonas alba]
MARITVVATEHPVPLPDGRTVLSAAERPEGTPVEQDIFILRRMAAGELVELPAEPPKPARAVKEG